jgi:hypothetical protein
VADMDTVKEMCMQVLRSVYRDPAECDVLCADWFEEESGGEEGKEKMEAMKKG